MAEKELGKNIAHYRKEKGLSQEKIAEYMCVSRQAVTKWESDVSRPSTENLLKLAQLLEVKVEVLLGNEDSAGENITEDAEQQGTESAEQVETAKRQEAAAIYTSNLSWIFIGISALSILLYTIISAWQGIFSAGIFICVFVMTVPVQLFLHVYFSNAVKNNSFTGIAGFDERIEYNLSEVKRLLVQMDLRLGMQTSVFVVLFCVLGCGNNKLPWLGGLLLCAYVLEFLGTILFLNFKSMDRLYVHETDKNRAKAEYPLIVAYIAVLVVGMGLLALLFEWKGIENNTLPALKLCGIYLLSVGVATVGVLLRKKGSWWCMITAVALYGLLFVIV